MPTKTEQFRWLVRLGFVARALLYSLLGIVALTGAGDVGDGPDGVFQAIENFPGGTAILWLMVAGLGGYGLFRLASAVFDVDNHGSDRSGIATRVGHFGSALGHFALAYSAFTLAQGWESSGDGSKEAAAGILSVQFGSVVLGLLGVAFMAAAAFQAKKGITGEFMHRISPAAPPATRWLGGCGYLARAVVFLVIGWSLVQAGWASSSAGIVTLGGAIASLADDGALFTIVALGLLLFGLFSLVLARYRIIPPMALDGRIPAFRA